MWVFAILVVLVLGGVAVVAAGRGVPMARVYDDRPDVTLPSSGPVSADDLRRVRFTLAFRGYRMSEVDALLDRLAREREPDEAPEQPVTQPVTQPVNQPVTQPVTEPTHGEEPTG